MSVSRSSLSGPSATSREGSDGGSFARNTSDAGATSLRSWRSSSICRIASMSSAFVGVWIRRGEASPGTKANCPTCTARSRNSAFSPSSRL